MALTQQQIEECKKTLNRLSHQVETLEQTLNADPDVNSLIHRFAECRASVNTLFSHVTGDEARESTGEGRPAWKSVAEKRSE